MGNPIPTASLAEPTQNYNPTLTRLLQVRHAIFAVGFVLLTSSPTTLLSRRQLRRPISEKDIDCSKENRHRVSPYMPTAE
jgi:hypothetical protein